MKTWIGSDFHFGHSNVIKYQPNTRGRFHSVEDMNETMIEEWNDLVDHDDLVYMLGDIAFMNGKEAAKIMRRLNGNKILIKGNHDYKLLLEKDFRDCFMKIYDYNTTKVDGTLVVMMHFPIHDWDRIHYGSVHLHGHSHGKRIGMDDLRILDVGFDSINRILMPMEEAVRIAKMGRIPESHRAK